MLGVCSRFVCRRTLGSVSFFSRMSVSVSRLRHSLCSVQSLCATIRWSSRSSAEKVTRPQVSKRTTRKRKVCLIVGYVGTRYCGLQMQSSLCNANIPVHHAIKQKAIEDVLLPVLHMHGFISTFNFGTQYNCCGMYTGVCATAATPTCSQTSIYYTNSITCIYV